MNFLDWRYVSVHKNVTWNIITNNIRYITGEQVPWQWEYVVANPNVTWENIQTINTMFKPKFSWSLLSRNINLTPTIIQENISKIDWSELSSNKLNYAKKTILSVKPETEQERFRRFSRSKSFS